MLSTLTVARQATYLLVPERVQVKEEIFYPYTDGEPMAESDFQYKFLVYVRDALDAHFSKKPNVYVSGNMFIYYAEGNPYKKVAPDVFVAFGVPKYQRYSYKVWEEGKIPDVVIEIVSKGNWKKDEQNINLYSRLGVKEYFRYDPTGDCLDPVLQGHWLDEDGTYQKMELETFPNGVQKLDSFLLNMELRLESGRLRLYDLKQEIYLFSYAEERLERLEAEAHAEEERLERLEAESHAKEAEARAEKERLERLESEARAEKERLESEARAKEQLKIRVELEARLRELEAELRQQKSVL